jgi:hypothetical protein
LSAEPPAPAKGTDMWGEDRITWASLAVALGGVILVAGFLTQQRAPVGVGDSGLVWLTFSLLCILGAAATLFPHICSPSTTLPEDLDPSRYTELLCVRLVHGHHPTCGGFQGHEFTLGEKRFCAGCTGLLIGAVAALAVTALYSYRGSQLPSLVGYVGLLFVSMGLLHVPLLEKEPRPLRVLFNALLVAGFSLVLASVDGLGNPTFDFVVVGLCVYWILTRIQLSRWSHNRVCRECEEPCDLRY